MLGRRHVIVSGRGAVSAGLHHKPRGRGGLAIGAVTGLLLGGIPVLVLPAAGYVIAKNISRGHNTIGMVNEFGQRVLVKLWKTGKHAPITEEGYWLVASDPRDSEMEIFIRRVLQRMGAVRFDAQSLRGFVLQHSGRHGLSSLTALQRDLSEAPWVEYE